LLLGLLPQTDGVMIEHHVSIPGWPHLARSEL
jgi:hypothetical protein